MLKKIELMMKNFMMRRNLGYFRVTIKRDAREGLDDWNFGYEIKDKEAVYDKKSGKMKITEIWKPVQTGNSVNDVSIQE